ncbi:hypothetical protein QWJ34_01655 [Saccharibacillus sp. CPCC 101409]|uniref:hypothetical protein n=1 Tax=Saccharibacillus sp. CPCC 101409 TaxID=3058041 RepID=UPI002671ACCD|nr:hypothetical protein [Saccharibacillus sp. CPCC 101409]MDO3408465.1 hypothetical protein [Saccharibacillus sp. CPCC 101409]
MKKQSEDAIKASSAAFALLALAILSLPLLPFIILGIGQAIQSIPDPSVYKKTQSFLEEKYGGEFEVKRMKQGWHDEYSGIAYTGKDRYSFHVAAFKAPHNYYVQDDYPLQQTIRPIIGQIFGDESKLVYEVEYSWPQLYTNNSGDWKDPLTQRAEREVSINIHLYSSDPDLTAHSAAFERLANEIAAEQLQLDNLSVVQVKAGAVDSEFLDKPYDKKEKSIIETYFWNEKQRKFRSRSDE